MNNVLLSYDEMKRKLKQLLYGDETVLLAISEKKLD